MKNLIKRSISVALLFFPVLNIQAQNCNCEDSFEKTIKTYETNYSLYQFKVTDENRDLYKAHKDVMRAKAKQSMSLIDCKLILEQWLDFFRDGHTYLSISAPLEVNNEEIPISEAQFKSN
jgi:hypothetical protein